MKKLIKRLWNYVKPAIEGDDGKFSYKRMSQIVFLHLFVYLAIKGPASVFAFHTILLVAVLFALTAVVITVPQLIKMLSTAKDIITVTSSTITNDTTTKNATIKATSTPVANEQHIAE